jgi:hypothetical protein
MAHAVRTPAVLDAATERKVRRLNRKGESGAIGMRGSGSGSGGKTTGGAV